MDLGSVAMVKTPVEVFEMVQRTFYTAKPLVREEENGAKKLVIKLTDSHNIEVTSALKAPSFGRKINAIKIGIHAGLNDETMRSRLNLSDCSTALPLEGWHLLERVFYEKDGLSCSTLIVDFLENYGKNQSIQHTISRLGFDPKRFNHPCSDKDFSYFEEALSEISKQPKPKKQSLLSKFETLYPKLYERHTNLLIDKKYQAELKDQQPDPYINIKKSLSNRVIGQSCAIEELSTLLASQHVRFCNRSFLFVGPTGVGKTELARAVAAEKGNRLIMLPMNQYQDEYHVSTLFGSAAGLVGSTDKPHLAKAFEEWNPIRKQENSKEIFELSDVVILFDELEKAHHKVRQSLLTLFESDYCNVRYTNTRGQNITNTYKLKNCILIATSNIYQNLILDWFEKGLSPATIRENFKTHSKKNYPNSNSFSPEFLSRSGIIPFGSIPKGKSFQKILLIQFNKFTAQLKEELQLRDVAIEKKERIIGALEESFYGNGTDLRNLEKNFDRIKGVIYREKRKWGNLESKKLLFSFNEKIGIYFQILIYLDEINVYKSIPDLPPVKL